jgi:hypothetical protein
VVIASLAVVGHLTELHHDRDFGRINQVYGEPAVECSRCEPFAGGRRLRQFPYRDSDHNGFQRAPLT